MHATQTFVIRLLIEPGEAAPLTGVLYNVREDADYTFESEEDLICLLRQLTRCLPEDSSRRLDNLREESEGNE